MPAAKRQVFRSPNLRLRIFLAASTGLVILALVVAATVSSAVEVRRSVDELSDLHLAAESFRSVNNGLLSMETNQRGFLLTGDSLYVARYDSAMKAVEGRVDSMNQVLAEFPGETDRFAALDSLVSVRLAQMNATLAAFHGENAQAAARQLERSELSGVMDSIRATLRILNAAQERRRLVVRAASSAAGRNLIWAEIIGGVFASILLLIGLRRIFADLNARESVETSLRRSERFLDSIIDMLPLMVVVKDARNLRFVRVNRTAEQLIGLPRESILSRDDAALFPKPLADGFTTLDRAVLASDVVRDTGEEVMVAPNGAVRTLHTRRIAIRDDAGEPAFLLAVSEDITERKRAEGDIERARQAAEAANRAKSDFLARMSHELRTPLNSIIGFSQLLEEESFGSLNERQRRYVRNVLTSGRQLLDLINDILDLSKVEAGRMELSLVHAPVLPLLREAAALVEPLAEARQLRVVLDAEAPLPAILVDVARFRQILNNLLGNAIKFTGPGGTITLRAGVSPNRSPSGSALVRITVLDTGVGVRPEDLERIFREFAQLDTELAAGHKGTGLGLALARSLAELHGGRLWAESEYGLGSSFHIELPVSPDAAAPVASGPPRRIASHAGRDGQPATVLVVEADAACAERLRGELEQHGYRVARATSARDAMEQVAEMHPDVIALSAAIAGGDGISVLHSLKADPRTARIPVVIVSIAEDHMRAVDIGAFDWLEKPVERDTLVAALHVALGDVPATHPLVLVIDDDPGALDVIAAIVEGAGFRVMSTTDPEHGLQLADTIVPSATIIDLVKSGPSGFELMIRLRELVRTRDVPVVIVGAQPFSSSQRQRFEHRLASLLSRPGAADVADELHRVGCVPRT